MRVTKWNDLKIIEYIENNGYVFVKFDENYNDEGWNKRVIIKCDNHKPYSVNFWNFKKGRRCPYCSCNLKEWTYNDVKSFIESKGYILNTKKDDYKNTSHKKLWLTCSEGHDWHVELKRFYDGVRCNTCQSKVTGEKLKLHESYVSSYIEKFGYKLNSKYEKSDAPLSILCDRGHEYVSTWDNFKSGCRCSICAITKGERKILDFLNNKGMKENCDYIYQKKYYGLIGVGGKNLSYDFYLPGYNILIEYQGEFHDGNTRHQTKEDLEKQQEHDRRKRQYAEEHGIRLLEIWYWEFDNIEEILSGELIK